MNTELKLRAWDKWNDCYEESIHRVMLKLNGSIYNSEYGDDQDDRYILIQYIGKLDVNNVRIFDKDIVKVSMYCGDDKYEAVGEVFFNNEQLCWMVDTGKGFVYLSYADVEVIGNMFQNKELLGD